MFFQCRILPFYRSIQSQVEELLRHTLRLLLVLRQQDNFTISVFIHIDSNENADIFKFAVHVAFQVNTVYIERVISGQFAIAPFFDVYIGFLIRIANGVHRRPTSTQGFRNILYLAHGHAVKVNFDQLFLRRAFTVAIALYDDSLKENAFQLWHFNAHLLRSRGRFLTVMPQTVSLPYFGALILGRACQFLRIFMEWFIQRLLYAASHEFFQFPRDGSLI